MPDELTTLTTSDATPDDELHAAGDTRRSSARRRATDRTVAPVATEVKPLMLRAAYTMAAAGAVEVGLRAGGRASTTPTCVVCAVILAKLVPRTVTNTDWRCLRSALLPLTQSTAEAATGLLSAHVSLPSTTARALLALTLTQGRMSVALAAEPMHTATRWRPLSRSTRSHARNKVEVSGRGAGPSVAGAANGHRPPSRMVALAPSAGFLTMGSVASA